MRKIVLFLISALGTITLFFVIWWESLGYYHPAEHWIKPVYEIKGAKAASIASPKIIIAGGSSSMFGIDSRVLENITGMPVVNLAAHRGLTLDYIAEELLLHVRTGDKVVLPLEFDYYKESDSLTSWQVNNMESWGSKHIKRNPYIAIKYFRFTSWSVALKRVYAREPIPSYDLSEIIRTVRAETENNITTWRGYGYLSMNSFGDMLVDAFPTTGVIETNYFDGIVTAESVLNLRKLNENLREIGAELIITWPPTLKNKKFDLSEFSAANKIHNIKSTLQKAGLTVKCDPIEAHFGREYFFDTVYHLNLRGAIKRSVALGRCLTDAPLTAEDLVAAEDRYYKRKEAGKLALLADSETVIGDLSTLKTALEDYKLKHGAYPITNGWDGLHSNWGESGDDWIKGLAPTYISKLPRDPRKNSDPSQQYVYKSNGSDFKLISHNPRDCMFLQSMWPALVDPERNCYAVGYWTTGAEKW